MKSLLTAHRSAVRLLCALLLLVGCTVAIFQATASVAASGHTGQALALSPPSPAAMAAALAAQKKGTGRFAYPVNFYQPRTSGLTAAGVHAHAANGNPVLISEGVQTYDVFAPPPGFLPGDGALTPTNLEPVWTSDGSRIIFASNRPHADPNGGATLVDDGTFHLWSVSAVGDDPTNQSATSSLHEITTSDGNEFFPTIYTATNAQLAFTSSVSHGTQNPNKIQNLYAVANFDAATSFYNVNGLTSLTIRTDLMTHFGEVDRPTWSPAGDRLVFSAIDSDGPFGPGPGVPGTHHLRILYVNSGGARSDASGFSPTNPPGELTNGPGDDTDPAWAPDASVDRIAFATTAGGFTAGSPGNPAVSLPPAATPLRSIYAVRSDSTLPVQITTAGKDDFGPAWNPNPIFAGYLTFARGASQAANHGIYFLTQVYQSGSSAISPETAGSALQLRTDDTANAYKKTYPSWSPIAVGTTSQPQAIVYASNRSITYNDPTTGSALETAISLAPGTNGIGANYTGLLVSQFDNVDPPTFLPYSVGENIHVTNGTDNKPRRNGDITPGNPVTLTVRLSNRESGVDDNNVYIQIKDPDSKYQDAQGLEHKVFTRDVLDDVNTPNGVFVDPNFGISAPALFLYNGGFGGAFGTTDRSPLSEQLSGNGDAAVSAYGDLFLPPFNLNVAEAEQTFTVNNNPYPVQQRGAIGGLDGSTAISVGHSSTTPSPITVTTGNPAVTKPLGDSDPSVFQSYGQEFECQFVDANFNNGGAVDTTATDYGPPFYLAGVDDQGSHTGDTHTPPRDTNGNLEWLKLSRLPNAQQDGQGGILYSATWTTPISASDYYLDVVAYDKAVLPLTPTTVSPNWRIYDNIWGFSTQAFQGGKDILVVADNTLGQKFVGSTFGGNGLENIPPIFYGAESYYTDIDINLLPNSIYRYVSVTGQMPKFTASDGTVVNLNDALPLPEVLNIVPMLTSEGGIAPSPLQPQIPANETAVLNGLGVDSYNDFLISQQTSTIGGFSVPVSQQYSLWRILARGPVDPQVLNAYSPSFQSQPAVTDPLTGFTAAAATVPVNHRCVIWAAPYAGDLPLNSVGSIADGSVQDELRAFVLGGSNGNVTFAGGGRLFVSGANIASTLGNTTVSNTAGSFLTDVLNASSLGTATGTFTGGSQNLSGGGENLKLRVSGDALFNPDKTPGVNDIESFFTQFVVNNPFAYAAPNAQPLILGNNYIDINGQTGLWRTDGSLGQLGPVPSTFGGANTAESQIGLITAQNGATVDTAFSIKGPGADNQTNGTGSGLIYKINSGPNGARVVFSSFGLEGIGIEYYKETVNNQDFFFARNQRPNILHNLVAFLRTATVTGRITQGSSGGQSGANATVYLIPNEGVPIPGTNANGTNTDGTTVRQTFSALTASDGSYQIQGVEPGAYFVVAYKAGFNRVETPTQHLVEGDSTTTFNLNLTPVPPGTITGTVHDGSGKGISGAALTFTSIDGLTKVTGTSRADGTYTITGVPATVYNGTADGTAIGFTTATAPDAGNPVTVNSGQTTSNINFTLTVIPGALGGLVKDSFTGLPVPGATITVTNAVSGAQVPVTGNPATTTTGSTPAAGLGGDGNLLNYVISGLTQGTYVVTVTPPQYYTVGGSATRTVTVTANTFTRVPDFSLDSTLGQLGGLVQETANDAPLPGAGKTLAGATVTAVDSTGKAFTFTTTATVTAPAAPTGDNQPLNVIGSVPPGAYTVTVSAPNFFAQPFSVTVATHQFSRIPPPPASGPVNMVSTLGTLGGLVKDIYNNAAIAGANVVITDASGNTILTGTTSNPPTASPSDGGITGDGGNVNYYSGITLPEGDYTVTASATNFTTKSFPFHVTHHQFKRGDVPLQSTQGTVGGLILDSKTGKPLGGASVTISTVPDANGNSTSIYSTTTAADGSTTSQAAGRYGDGNPVNFATTLTAGTYQVTVAKQGAGTAAQPDYVTQTFQITVKPDVFLRTDTTLIYAYGTVGGLIRDSFTQGLLAGATITVADSTGNVVATVTGRNTTSSPAAPLGDGQPLNYTTNQVLYGGSGTTYTVTVTATNHKAQNRNVTVTGSRFTRADFDVVSTIGYVGGLVLDSTSGTTVGGATVTIKDASGAVVTTFTTAATTSTSTVPTGDGNAVNYSGPLTVGTYTAVVTRRGYGTTTTQTFTIQPNQFTRVDFSGTTNGLPAIHVFGAGYNFFSVPYDYSSIGVGFDDLFGTLNTGTRTAPSAGSNRSHIFVWNPQLVQYVLDPTAPADGLHLGQGYWVYLLNAHEVTVAGNTPTASSVTVSLHQGWNQIGVPSLSAVSVSNMTFNNAATGATINFANASGSVYRLVSGTLYGYNGSSYYTVTSGGSLQPWQAYWIYAFTDVTVNIPTR